ncbi:MAG: response regulator [Candidatus Competibacteraceae bacterium]|nr:response regulator [Candidatus Competibacteraceae bacterium]
MPKNTNTILIADSDPSALSNLNQTLTAAGYQVLEATSGSQVLALSQQYHPDLVVLDVHLPEPTGIEVGRQLMGHQVPFLFVSSSGDGEVARQAMEEGAFGYLIKPLEAENLLPTLEAVLERAQELRRLKENEIHLNRALEQSRDISVAIGLMMERHRLGERAAFESLRSLARSQRRKLEEVARDVVRCTEVINRLNPSGPVGERRSG